ncbi:PREDICTED: uncharacterized protein LOC102014254 [Chinchilla lanigera]|uniref:uncharacterized protein LOC102014254 n=1 Tax=Chinchilla lanigera TaxID=34839 RepID=UPI0006961136|nr:PREDICTED: uncharacterized protein LOC102014254 [Chinchilla lanigera]
MPTEVSHSQGCSAKRLRLLERMGRETRGPGRAVWKVQEASARVEAAAPLGAGCCGSSPGRRSKNPRLLLKGKVYFGSRFRSFSPWSAEHALRLWGTSRSIPQHSDLRFTHPLSKRCTELLRYPETPPWATPAQQRNISVAHAPRPFETWSCRVCFGDVISLRTVFLASWKMSAVPGSIGSDPPLLGTAPPPWLPANAGCSCPAGGISVPLSMVLDSAQASFVLASCFLHLEKREFSELPTIAVRLEGNAIVSWIIIPREMQDPREEDDKALSNTSHDA